jgi:hypothetical protein
MGSAMNSASHAMAQEINTVKARFTMSLMSELQAATSY